MPNGGLGPAHTIGSKADVLSVLLPAQSSGYLNTFLIFLSHWAEQQMQLTWKLSVCPPLNHNLYVRLCKSEVVLSPSAHCRHLGTLEAA